jgi:hypothetical protein
MVGLMLGVSPTVLGVLIIVGEYAVDSSENDLTMLSGTFKTLLNVGEGGVSFLADFGDARFVSGEVDAAHRLSQTHLGGGLRGPSMQ